MPTEANKGKAGYHRYFTKVSPLLVFALLLLLSMILRLYNLLVQLHSDVQAIFDMVAEASGKPVEIVPEPNLPTLAKIVRARGSSPLHVVAYKPGSPGIDYVLAYQTAFTLRFYQSDPEERADFSASSTGRDSVKRMLLEPGGVIQKMKLPRSAADQLAAQFFDGLMTQLRSFPIGMRIDQWLFESFPALRSAQRDSMDSQQRENLQILSPQIRAIAPPAVYNPNVSMNAAYAVFCDRLLENPAYTIPYRSTAFLARAEALLSILESIPADANHDRALVDAWADELGLGDWTEWIPA